MVDVSTLAWPYGHILLSTSRYRFRPWRRLATGTVLLALPECSVALAGYNGLLLPVVAALLGLGIVAAVIVRQLLSALGLDDFVVLPFATYGAVALSVTFLVWLIRFGD